MDSSSKRCNGMEHVPACSVWPPRWLAEADGAVEMPTPAPSTGTALTPSTLPPDLREAWEERAAIMQYDGGLPFEEAERLALADVLRNHKRHDLE